MDIDFSLDKNHAVTALLVFIAFTIFVYVGTAPPSDPPVFAVAGWVPLVALSFAICSLFILKVNDLKYFPLFLAFNISSILSFNEHLLTDFVALCFSAALLLVAYRKPLESLVALVIYLISFSIASLIVSLPALVNYFEKTGLLYAYWSSSPHGFLVPPRATGISRSFALCGLVSLLLLMNFRVSAFLKGVLASMGVISGMVVIAIPSRGVLLSIGIALIYLCWRERSQVLQVYRSNRGVFLVVLSAVFAGVLATISSRFESFNIFFEGSGRLTYWLRFVDLIPDLLWAGGEFYDKQVLGQVVSNGLAYAICSGGVIGFGFALVHVTLTLQTCIRIEQTGVSKIIVPVIVFLASRTLVENGLFSIGIDQMIWAVCIGILAAESHRGIRCRKYF